VTTTVTRTNERVADINARTPNPAVINDWYAIGYFTIRVTAQNNLPLAAVRVYGAGLTNAFPPPNTPGEALIATATAIGLNQGLVRAPAMHQQDGDVPGRPCVIPATLLLEYSTGAPGAAPTITFEVAAVFLGQHVSAVER